MTARPGETQYEQPAPEFVAAGAEDVDAADRRAAQEAQRAGLDADAPIDAMADIGAAAARMLAENPDLQAEAEALRRRMTEARRDRIEPSADAARSGRRARLGSEAATREQLEARIQAARAQGREDVAAVRALQALRDDETTFMQPDPDGGEARGAIRFGADRKATIELFRTADLSTFLHESAHLWLEVFGDVVTELAGRPAETLSETQRRMVGDYTTLLAWLGVGSRADVGRTQHEQFARGFEAYLMEGQAPSPELRSIFARVRAWLVQVYRSLGTLRVELSPEVRGVMDRLLGDRRGDRRRATGRAGCAPDDRRRSRAR